jgi:UDP-2,3-diacylglucosamine pyrophosphatase LpxH
MTSQGEGEMRLPLSKIRRRILDTVRANPDLTPDDVAKQVGVHVLTVKRNYRWFEAHGLGRIIHGHGRGNVTHFIPQ